MIPAEKSPELIVRSEQPFNAGPRLPRLREAEVTPTPLFFVRNHGPIPAIDVPSYRLSVGGAVRHPLQLSLDELRSRFETVTLDATLQCAGNRRSELIAVEPIPGELPWGDEAISNAQWRGVRLRDVIAAAGPDETAAHAAFNGLDDVERHGNTFGFGGSIPLAKARNPDVLLAFEMNGASLPPTHGFPLRVVAPGYIGARSVKWLSAITLQPEPSDNYFQQHAYKLFPPHVKAETVDWSQGTMLGTLNVNSLICEPAAGTRVGAGSVVVRGLAIAGDGLVVERVELSADGGRSWSPTSFVSPAQPGVWRFWETMLELQPGEVELVARAFDSAGNSQPAEVAPLWNFKGYMNNAWHRVQLSVGAEQDV